MHTLSICYINSLTCSQSHWLIENFCSHNQRKSFLWWLISRESGKRGEKRSRGMKEGPDLVWSSGRVVFYNGPSSCCCNWYLKIKVPSSPSPASTPQPRAGRDPSASSLRSCHLLRNVSAEHQEPLTPPRADWGAHARSRGQHRDAVVGDAVNASLSMNSPRTFILPNHAHGFLQLG